VPRIVPSPSRSPLAASHRDRVRLAALAKVGLQEQRDARLLLTVLALAVIFLLGRVSAQQPDLLYVCVQDDAKVAVVDMAAKSVLRTIDFQKLGFPATAKPHYIVVEPDGSHWYVSLIGANRVVKLDRQDRIVGQYEMETPGMLAFAGADRLVVSRSMSAVNPPKRVAILNRAAMSGDEVEVLFARPHPVAVTTAGYGFTGSLGVNQIAVLDLTSKDVTGVRISNVSGPTHSFVQFAVSREGTLLAATTEVSGQLLLFDLSEPASPKLSRSIDVGKMAFDPVFTPDEEFIWVPVKSTNEIVIVSTKSGAEAARLKDASLKQPHQIVFSADGATAFVTNNNKMDHMADPAHAGHAMPASGDAASLVVIDVKTQKVVKAIPLGKNLTGMGTRARR
jgi:DNA-binding beta-propeller fold protein YncE